MAQAKYDDQIYKLENVYSIERGLLKAVIKRESGYNPNAIGRHGEIGLGQITTDALEDFNKWSKESNNKQRLFDPMFNLEVSAWYLGYQVPKFLKHYGLEVSRKNIVWSYNAGIGNVLKGNLPRSTKSYIDFVNNELKKKDTYLKLLLTGISSYIAYKGIKR